METVVLGEDITFTKRYYDGDGADFDPPSVRLDIVRSANTVVWGPFITEVDNFTPGGYRYTLTVSRTITPGIYAAKWISTDYNNDPTVDYDYFQILDFPVVPNELLDAPRTYGVIREGPRFTQMGLGATDRIFLVGHADGLTLNDPYHIGSMQEIINILGADGNSPLVRGLLEAYNSGARDIWVVAAAPMGEYVEDLASRSTPREEWGNLNFYERYFERLETTYAVLRDFDYPEYIIPLEAPFYNSGDVDFLTQLVDHCGDAFANTGSPRIGIIGTRINEWSSSDIEAMANDARLDTINADYGKFVLVAIGEGIFSYSHMPVGYRGSLVASLAGLISSTDLNRSPIFQVLPGVAGVVGRNLSKAEIKSLTDAKLNVFTRTTKGRRGTPFQIVLSTDNTLAAHGSDFWSLNQLKTVAKILQEVRTMGRRSIGNVGYPRFKQEVEDYMAFLLSVRMIKDYKLNIYRNPLNSEGIIVDIAVTPMYGVRELFFVVEVGPGK